MKSIYFFVFLITSVVVVSCSQPVGQSLLSSAGKNTSTTVDDTDSTTPEVLPETTSVNVFIDDSDRAEITGTCKDLDRKDNRILVEVFTGEDETITPYISNAISDFCQTLDAGIPTTDKCFWVTNGYGLKEEQGLPTERTFPHCHNGRFGFSIKLGKLLQTSTAGVYDKYTVRLKLRTVDGTLSDTNWQRVTIDRSLRTPVIESIAFDNSIYSCKINTLPSRFNQDIAYTLTRTYSDSLNSGAGSTNLYANSPASDITAGSSVFEWDDSSDAVSNNFIIEGVTYNYTLTSTVTSPSLYYTFPLPTADSGTGTCTTNRPSITMSANPTAGTCYLTINSTINPSVSGLPVSGTDVWYEWARGGTPWIGSGANVDAPNATVSLANCTGNMPITSSTKTTICTDTGLTSNTTYYYAVRARSQDGQKGLWSPIQSCRPP